MRRKVRCFWRQPFNFWTRPLKTSISGSDTWQMDNRSLKIHRFHCLSKLASPFWSSSAHSRQVRIHYPADTLSFDRLEHMQQLPRWCQQDSEISCAGRPPVRASTPPLVCRIQTFLLPMCLPTTVGSSLFSDISIRNLSTQTLHLPPIHTSCSSQWDSPPSQLAIHLSARKLK